MQWDSAYFGQWTQCKKIKNPSPSQTEKREKPPNHVGEAIPQAHVDMSAIIATNGAHCSCM